MTSEHDSTGSQTEPTRVQAAAAPVTDKERYLSLDVVRGAALFGILIMNMLGFAYALSPKEYMDPVSRIGADFWSWVVMSAFFEGTQRTLFSILFGAGVIMITARTKKADGAHVADIYYRRNIWLIAFGLANAYILLWEGDILYYYGIAALFLYPLRNVSPRNLIAVAVAGLLLLMLQYGIDVYAIKKDQREYQQATTLQANGAELTKLQQLAIDEWEAAEQEWIPTEEKTQLGIDARTGGYLTTLRHHVPRLTNSHGNETYRFYFLDALSIMLIGMALYKLGFLTLKRSSRTYWMMALIGLGVGLPINWWETQFMLDQNFSRSAMTEVKLTYDIGRLSLGIGHLGLLLLFVRSGWLPRLQRGLASVGQMALTNYLAQSVIAAILFLGIGFGLYGSLSRIEVYSVGLAIVLFQLWYSQLWLRHYRFGPLEWVWRSLTYLKKQPMKRKTPTAPRIARSHI